MVMGFQITLTPPNNKEVRLEFEFPYLDGIYGLVLGRFKGLDCSDALKPCTLFWIAAAQALS